jgi:hypothetical protein
MKDSMNTRILAGAAAVFLLTVSLQIDIDERKQNLEQRLSRPFVPPRADAVRVAAMGYQTLLADAYWLRAIQYCVETIEKGQVPNDLYPMTDFITDLDPRFCFAYYFTGLNLMLNGGNDSSVVAILEKGKKQCPQYWKAPFLLGFYYYYALEQYDLAAENLELAYKLTGFRNFALLAARIRSEGGKPEIAIQLLTNMAQQTDDPNARKPYLQRIAELQAQVIIIKLNQAVDKFFQVEGRYPADTTELVRRGGIAGIPAHPVAGHRFVYSPSSHRFDNEPQIFIGVFINPRKKLR